MNVEIFGYNIKNLCAQFSSFQNMKKITLFMIGNIIIGDFGDDLFEFIENHEGIVINM